MWETLAAINLPPTKLWDGFYIDDWGMVSDWVYLMTLTYVNQYVYIYSVGWYYLDPYPDGFS